MNDDLKEMGTNSTSSFQSKEMLDALFRNPQKSVSEEFTSPSSASPETTFDGVSSSSMSSFPNNKIEEGGNEGASSINNVPLQSGFQETNPVSSDNSSFDDSFELPQVTIQDPNNDFENITESTSVPSQEGNTFSTMQENNNSFGLGNEVSSFSSEETASATNENMVNAVDEVPYMENVSAPIGDASLNFFPNDTGNIVENSTMSFQGNDSYSSGVQESASSFVPNNGMENDVSEVSTYGEMNPAMGDTPISVIPNDIPQVPIEETGMNYSMDTMNGQEPVMNSAIEAPLDSTISNSMPNADPIEANMLLDEAFQTPVENMNTGYEDIGTRGVGEVVSPVPGAVGVIDSADLPYDSIPNMQANPNGEAAAVHFSNDINVNNESTSSNYMMEENTSKTVEEIDLDKRNNSGLIFILIFGLIILIFIILLPYISDFI